MNENISHKPVETNHEKLNHIHEKYEQKAEHQQKVEATEHNHNIDRIQESIHKEALNTKDIVVGEAHQNSSRPIIGMQRELKIDAYKQTMQKVHSHLSPAERTFSKVIHNRIIEPISELSSKTIARPSGILGSGFVTLIGSGVVLYMAKHYGFRYNFTIFFLFLVCGFCIGLLLEFLAQLIRSKHG